MATREQPMDGVGTSSTHEALMEKDEVKSISFNQDFT